MGDTTTWAHIILQRLHPPSASDPTGAEGLYHVLPADLRDAAAVAQVLESAHIDYRWVRMLRGGYATGCVCVLGGSVGDGTLLYDDGVAGFYVLAS